MNGQQALAILLEQVEGALQKSLARHNAAALDSDFEAVEIEVERQRNLVSARNQLQGLQELWPGLVGELLQQPAEESGPVARAFNGGRAFSFDFQRPPHLCSIQRPSLRSCLAAQSSYFSRWARILKSQQRSFGRCRWDIG